MSSPTIIDPQPAAAGRTVASAELWRLTDGELTDTLAQEEAAARRQEYRRLRLLAEFHARDIAGRQAGLSTQAFLRHRFLMSPAEAARRVHAAEEFVESTAPSGEPVPAQLPATAAALASEAISSAHAQVVSIAIRQLPTGLDPRIRNQAEEFLATQAHELDPAQLRTAARRLRTVLDPDGTIDDDAPARRELSFRRDVDGTDVISGRLDPEGSATFQAALAGYVRPQPGADGAPDRRSPARRRGDALVALSEAVLKRPDRPTVGGAKPHVSVSIRLDDLRGAPTSGQRRYGVLDTGVAITPESARRIACDAGIIPILLGGQSEPLDVGRSTRSIPPGIRRAAVARDTGCIHPGCAHAASECEVHHVRHWADGGRTALDNLVLLCPRHHWTTHHENWRIRFLAGVPHVIPPPIVDPRQRPRRNTFHDIPDG